MNRMVISFGLIFSFWLGYYVSYKFNEKTEIKEEVVRHESHKNIYHKDNGKTEVYSHTFRYGDSMVVEIDTFKYSGL